MIYCKRLQLPDFSCFFPPVHSAGCCVTSLTDVQSVSVNKLWFVHCYVQSEDLLWVFKQWQSDDVKQMFNIKFRKSEKPQTLLTVWVTSQEPCLWFVCIFMKVLPVKVTLKSNSASVKFLCRAGDRYCAVVRMMLHDGNKHISEAWKHWWIVSCRLLVCLTCWWGASWCSSRGGKYWASSDF